MKDTPDDLSVSLDELLALTPAQAPRAASTPAEGDLTLQAQQHRKQQLEIEAGVHRRAGRIEETERVLNAILELDPRDTRALYNLGVLAAEANEIARAERYLRGALDTDPEFIDAYQAFGDMHYKARHVLSAIEIFERGLKHAPNRLPLLKSLLQARVVQRIPHRVAEVAERILRIDEGNMEAIYLLAWADLTRGADLAASERRVGALLEENGDRPAVLAIAIEIARRKGDAAQADKLSARLELLTNHDFNAARLSADVYVGLSQFDRAGEIVRRFLEHQPGNESAMKYLATVLFQEGEFRAGHRILEQVVEGGYKYPTLDMVFGLNAFRLGDIDTFYRLHHTRWARDGAEEIWDVPVPEWKGEPVKNGKLLVFCEQGVGDHVMYATSFDALADKARDVVIETLPRIAPLFQRSFPQYQVIHRGRLPADWSVETISAKAPAGDLPMLIGGDLEQLPGRSGFLVADPNLVTKFRDRYRQMFPGKRVVGISWRSGNRDSAAIRSLDLPYWKQLLELPDYAFVSLQYGDVKRDIEELKAQLGDKVYVDPEVNPLGNMDPFTAQIAAVDMVISVDNSTIHFAGGLGKPCFAMLPINTDWRWQLDRTDTVWYDSLELFRQDQASGWDGVIERIAARLATLDTETLQAADRRYYYRSAKVLSKAQRHGEAEGYWRLLLANGDHKAEAMQGIALSALTAGHPQDAVAILHRAIALAPDDIGIKADFVWALANAGEDDRALGLARQLTRDHTENAAAQTACGRILWKMSREDEATDHFARVLRRDAADVPTRLALAGLQAAQGEWDLARGNYRKVTELQRGNAIAHTALAEIALRFSEWPEGWSEFGWRFGTWPGTPPHHFNSIDPDRQPKRWPGGSLRKTRVFLRAERSTVEQLLFADLIPEVAKESRHILAECDPRLLAIMQASFPDIVLQAAGTTGDAELTEQKIQIASSLGDLAARYRGNAADFPVRSRAWLKVDAGRAGTLCEEYRACFPGRALVGLSWRHAGSDSGNTTLREWLRLIDRPDIGVVALHPAPSDAELSSFGAETGRDLIHDRRADGKDLMQFCIQIAACDFVIAVDDLTACLAAAMGKPMLKLVGARDHWWWGTEGASSVWFPGVRLIRGGSVEAALAALGNTDFSAARRA